MQTIDGLSHWLAQRLPLAAQVALSAALVDDARPLYREAARRLVSALEADDERSGPLDRLARTLDHDPGQLAGLVADMLGTREVWLPKLFGEPDRSRLRAVIDELLCTALETELARLRARLAGCASPSLFEIVRAAAAAGGAAGPLASFRDLRGWPPASAGAVQDWLALADLLLTASKDGAVRKKVESAQGFLPATAGTEWRELKRRMKEELDALAAAEGFAATLARVRRLPPARLTDGQWYRVEALLAVLPHAVAELVALFAERESLDHPAVAAAARDALRDESAPTELALALDYRIRHLLVDEYQDTSPAQERLLALLLAGWQRGDGRTLFCVGDPMQSIYAFREADVTLFLQAAEEGVGGVPLEALRLGRNFRSSRAIVDWVNATFASLLPAEDDFERGAVRYSSADPAHEAVPGDGVWVHALLDADERAMGETVARIAAESRAASPEGRPPGIAVLVRPVVAAPGGRCAPPGRHRLPRHRARIPLDRASIRDLVALAKAMLHAADRTAWLAILRAPWCGLHARRPARIRTGDAKRRLARCARSGAAVAGRRASRRAPAGGARARDLRPRAAHRSAAGSSPPGSRSRGPRPWRTPSDLANAELLFSALDRLESESGAWPEASEIDGVVDDIRRRPSGATTRLCRS